jgi:hypothetical protein
LIIVEKNSRAATIQRSLGIFTGLPEYCAPTGRCQAS